MRRIALALSPLVFLAAVSSARTEDKPEVLNVWPGTPPTETKPIAEEKATKSKGVVTGITNVSKPMLSVFHPDKDKDTGAAVVVCPGGGYSFLAWAHEGEDVAAWLNSIGVTGIVLKYRVPRRPDQDPKKPPLGALQDAQRTLSLARSKAKEWKIDPNRIGILGFSAGGHLAAWASTHFDKRAYEPMDDIDKVNCRPDFAVLIYPGYLAEKDKEILNPDIRVRKDCPPMFLVHANNDPVIPENSVRMYLALKRAGVPAEMHIYASGGHGFGMRPSDKPCSTWPKRCAEWLQSQGLLKNEKAASAASR
jgi:acetyl esterase/lipase